MNDEIKKFVYDWLEYRTPKQDYDNVEGYALAKEYIANYDSTFVNIIYDIDSILSSSFLFRSTQQKSHFWGEKSAKWEIHILHNIRTFILLYGTKRH